MLKVTGSLTVEVKKEIVIDGSEFELVEDGNRSLPDGERQYEALFVYHDHETGLEISFQATMSDDGEIERYGYSIPRDAKILEDSIVCEPSGR